jgi:membrane protease YdiL (CAAX protease family)
MTEWIRRLSARGEFFTVILLGFSYFILNSAAALIRGIHHLDLTTARLLYGAAIELALLFVVCWLLKVRGWSVDRLGLRFSVGSALAGIPLAIAYLLLYWFSALTVASMAGVRRIDSIEMRWLAPMALTVAYLILNSVYEELIVAGYVISALSGEGAAYAITASTLLRFLYHLYQGPVAALSILPMGLLFGTIYWRSRSLWPLMVAHTLMNILSVLTSGRG